MSVLWYIGVTFVFGSDKGPCREWCACADSLPYKGETVTKSKALAPGTRAGGTVAVPEVALSFGAVEPKGAAGRKAAAEPARARRPNLRYMLNMRPRSFTSYINDVLGNTHELVHKSVCKSILEEKRCR